MERPKLAAISKYVLRDRQHLGCLRVRDGVITLEKMFSTTSSGRRSTSRRAASRSRRPSWRWRPR